MDVLRMRRDQDVGGLVRYLTEMSADEGSGLTVRAAAARALGKLHAVPAIDGLVTLLADPDLDVRLAAAKALGAIPSRSSVPALEKFVDAAHTDAERIIAMEALASLGGVDTPSETVSALSRDPNKRVASAARRALSGEPKRKLF
jgi:HEAT repeat protein